ncbi:MAG: hypothetical protein AAFY88_13055, partial [Acidobacteriota bacterium]
RLLLVHAVNGWGLDGAQLASVAAVVLGAPVLVAVHSALRRRGWGLVAAAAAHGVAWWLLCRFASASTGPFGAADWLAGAAALGALWLGWFQIYSTLCRGFSMQLLVELGAGDASARRLAESYAGGLGVDWLLEKRLRGLAAAGLVADLVADGGVADSSDTAPDEALRATPRGRALAEVSAVYKNLVGIGAGG